MPASNRSILIGSSERTGIMADDAPDAAIADSQTQLPEAEAHRHGLQGRPCWALRRGKQR
jgi:hypothetical protein